VLGVPAGFGCTSAHFSTGDATGTPLQDKAQLINFTQTGTALSAIHTISYWAYRSSASTGGTAPHLALNVSITGSTVLPTGFATLVYEPYNQSGGEAAIVNDTWQHWDATATTLGDGAWWTSKIAIPRQVAKRSRSHGPRSSCSTRTRRSSGSASISARITRT